MRPRGKFMRIKCKDCGQEQVIFGKASCVVHCLVCNKVVATPTGGKCKIHTDIIGVM